MKKLLASLLVSGSFLVMACGPSATDTEGGGNGDGGLVNHTPDAGVDFGPVGSISGTVWAPGNAPGMVPAGQEIPVATALVFITVNQPDPIPQTVYCDKCTNPAATRFVKTDEKGRFSMTGIKPGFYWISAQKGQFRRETRLEIVADHDLAMTTDQTTLPSKTDPANGMWIPKIALASGFWDKMEDILGKMKMGTVNATGTFNGPTHMGVFDVFANDGAIDTEAGNKTLDTLIGDLNMMKQYHIIFVPCSDGSNTTLFSNPTYRSNIKEYVKAGGKFYVTDWSAEWEDAVFPDFLVFQGSTVDTPAGATSNFGDGDGSPGYSSKHAKALDTTLNKWLDGQQGPQVDPAGGGVFGSGGYINGTFNANDFEVEGNWDRITQTPSIAIGTGMDGLPLYDTAKGFVVGDWDGDGMTHPLTVTFEPTGCGRVLYSTYHTADSEHVGLIPQERVLVYLIMEIGICKSGPIIN